MDAGDLRGPGYTGSYPTTTPGLIPLMQYYDYQNATVQISEVPDADTLATLGPALENATSAGETAVGMNASGMPTIRTPGGVNDVLNAILTPGDTLPLAPLTSLNDTSAAAGSTNPSVIPLVQLPATATPGNATTVGGATGTTNVTQEASSSTPAGATGRDAAAAGSGRSALPEDIREAEESKPGASGASEVSGAGNQLNQGVTAPGGNGAATSTPASTAAAGQGTPGNSQLSSPGNATRRGAPGGAPGSTDDVPYRR